MNISVAAEQRIVLLDLRISRLKLDLDKLAAFKKPLDLAQRQRKSQVEREVKQLQLLLNYILQDLPRPFHYYRLPPEMRVEILQYVNSPADKLTLAQTLPDIGPLMNWDQGALYFTLIYPLVFEYLDRDWLSSYNMCRVSPAFQQVVLDHHRHRMSGPGHGVDSIPDYFSHQLDRNNVINDLDSIDLSECPWMKDMPFLFTVTLLLLRGDLDSFREGQNGQLSQFLDRYGHRIWSAWIAVANEAPGESVHRVLAKTPNLYYLQVSQLFPTPAENPNARLLPPLPNLKLLRLAQHTGEILARQMLQQYGKNLTRLQRIGGLPDGHFDLEKLKCCQLWCPSDILRNMASLGNSPISSLCLTFGQDDQRIHIARLFQILSQFGNTLEHLRIEYHPSMEEPEDWTGFQGNDWAALVVLPRLKTLDLEGYVGRVDFLLALDSLRTLAVSNYRPEERVGGGEASSLLRLPWDANSKYDTNVWSILTKLTVVKMANYGRQMSTQWTVTRGEHEQHLRSQ